jgi:hypothetical protein
MTPYENNSYQTKYSFLPDPIWPWLVLGGLFVIALILAMGVVALLLPPLSLLSRLDTSYVPVGPEGNTLHDPDGLQITFPPEGVSGSFRVKLETVPRNLFLEGAAGAALQPAAASIPAHLVLKSPYYQLQARGGEPNLVIMTIPIPNESEPYNTLDLYTWDGEAWVWLPSRVIAGDEVIESKLNFLPKSVVVMQTHPLNPQVVGSYTTGQTIPENFRTAPMEINPQGLYLEAEGLVAGNLGQLPPEILNSTFAIIPTLRNWSDDGSVRSDLIDNLLIDDEARQRHVATIVSMAQNTAFRGVALDYRGIDPGLRDDFTSFLKELRQALPIDKQLIVRVDMPQPQSAETWETGAYDWQAIGRLADMVRIPALPDPKAYAADGQMAQLLAWAVGQVGRQKLQLDTTTHSLEQINGQTREIGYQEAITSLGAVTVAGGATTLGPNQPVEFNLSGLQNGAAVQFDPDSGLYWFSYPANPAGPRIIYLENAASIARQLQLIAQYNLRGVSVQNLFEANSDPQIREAIYQFVNLALSPVEGQHALIWQVKNQEGGLIAEQVVDLSAPVFRWTTPAAPGVYQITAGISPNRNPATASPLGSLSVTVAGP